MTMGSSRQKKKKKKRSIFPLSPLSINTDDQYFLQNSEAENLTILCAVLWLVGQSCLTLCDTIDYRPQHQAPQYMQSTLKNDLHQYSKIVKKLN